MGGRMVTLKDSQKSVAAYQAEQTAKRNSPRVSAEFKVNDFVMVERRGGQVRGVLGGGVYVVRMDDTGDNEQQFEGDLVRVFRSQTSGYMPKRAGRSEINEGDES